jgi:hypothetical protein
VKTCVRPALAWVLLAFLLFASIGSIAPASGALPGLPSDAAPAGPSGSAPANPPAEGPLETPAPAVWFEENRGQWAPEAQYKVNGIGFTAFLSQGKLVAVLSEPDTAGRSGSAPAHHAAIATVFEGANPRADVSAAGQGGPTNYFLGSDPAGWITGVPTYSEVTFAGLYRGVDLVYHGRDGGLEYDFVVQPGASPHDIRLRFEGADNVRLDDNGELALETGVGALHLKAPGSYQDLPSGRQAVASRYALEPQGHVRIDIDGGYDPSRPLVIDPLTYSTYLGGTGGEDTSGTAGRSDGRTVSRMTLDGSRNAYVTGYTESTGYPVTTGAYQTSQPGNRDAFVTKLSPTGAMVYSTFLGGPIEDYGSDIAVDASGNAYVTGNTYDGFPTTPGAFRTTTSCCSDVFITKLNPTGSGLVYSTYLIGPPGYGTVNSVGIAIDGAGNAYVTGDAVGGIPTTVGAFRQSRPGGWNDVFVVKLNTVGSGIVYGTYLGGSGYDESTAISVDASGIAHVTGRTDSSNFPLSSPYQSNPGGGYDAFAAALNAAGGNLVYSTYLGGSSDDEAGDLAIDTAGNIYVAGSTWSTNFPTAGAMQAALSGSSDAFVAKLGPSGSALTYSTYLGGSGGDGANGLWADASGNAFITGWTTSSNFPAPAGAYATTYRGGSSDAFVTKINAAGRGLSYSTYLGGSGLDEGNSIVADSTGSAYVTGITASTNYPAVSAFDASFGGATDLFVTKFASTDTGNNAPDSCLSLTATYLQVTADYPCNDPDGNAMTFTLSWGDGSAPLTTTSRPFPTHAYQGAGYCPSGTATVTLTASDARGGRMTQVVSLGISDAGHDQDPMPSGATGDGLVACLESAQQTSDLDWDTDHDGLSDYAESSSWPSRNLIFCGASTCAYPTPTQRDLYVEIDWQTGFELTPGALSLVSNAYAASPLTTDIHLYLDTGQLGGGGAELGPAGNTDVENSYANHMTAARKDYYHYAAVGCANDSGGLRQGVARTPGNRLGLFLGNDVACTTRIDDGGSAALFLHELGHNILGSHLKASGGNPNAGTCNPNSPYINALLNDDFTYNDNNAKDCDGDTLKDIFGHSIRNDDAMFGGGVGTQTTYRGTTWDAMKLNFGVGPLAPACDAAITGNPTADDLLWSGIRTAKATTGLGSTPADTLISCMSAGHVHNDRIA